MRQYKIVASILFIVPIINFALALPIIEGQDTSQLDGDVSHDVAVTTQAKRGGVEEMDKLWDTYFERLFGKPDTPSGSASETGQHAPPQNPASSTVPDQGPMDSHQMETSEIQQESPELTKSPSLGHYLESPESDASLSHYLKSTPDSEHSTAESESPSSQPEVQSPQVGNSPSKSFMSKMFSKLKFWRRIPGSGPVVDAVNAELQGLVNTGVYVSVSSPELQRS